MNRDPAPGGPRILHISPTTKLGGVSEVIRSELPHLAELGWRARWIAANDLDEAHDAAFVLHNALYGVPVGDFPAAAVRQGVERFLAANAERAVAAAREADVVVLHDAMMLNLATAVRSALGPAAPVLVWRCHVGSEHLETIDRAAVDFLRPQLDAVDHLVFSHRDLVWSGWEDDPRITVVPPGIDPGSWKNRELSEEVRAAVWPYLHAARGVSVAELTGEEDAVVEVHDFGTGGLRAPDSPFVLQVSRWDPLKGQLGVVRAFEHLAHRDADVELVLVGPHIDDRENYPANRRVWQGLMDARAELPTPVRERVHIWRFGPVRRTGEDIALNLLRRRARTVVQNSSRESFGLTVTEAMWQGAVVVGADVDGIRGQIRHEANGLLTPFTEGRPGGSAGDAGPWAETVLRSLTDGPGRARWGAAARASVEEHHLSRAGVERQVAAFTGGPVGTPAGAESPVRAGFR
ncbi:glycosyltransferase [Streptomyces sp. TRM 70361]|uniref:glycosyltransferase n=1 Tax=Streptomyces sp. TRM 70361 TaxID=3116553 RepID=UPI002E7C3A86|nr:glycosyltransferase [Streptomyces sp. TRM 70361]MEE1939579.1 glycosyltransferase [Streptomyces sp. TRM 70361]